MKTIAEIRARLTAIAAALEAMKPAGEDGSFSAEQNDEIEAHNTEFTDLEAKLDKLEKIEDMKARAAAPAARKVAGADPAPARPIITKAENERFGGFKSSGEFLQAVKAASAGQIASQFKSAAYERTGEDGGYLVPEDISTEIVKKLEHSDSLAARCRELTIGGSSMGFPIDESQPWNSGVQAYWTEEGGTITESKPKFGRAEFRLHKLAALVKASDELLDDAAALESYIKGAAPEAIMHKVNKAIINGSGSGTPKGLLDSPFTVQVAKESGQAADTILAANVINMYSRMLPGSRARAVWLVNAQAEPQLNGLKDGAGNYISFGPGIMGINQSPLGVLMGRPVVPMMSALPALGDVGDILFVDLQYYWLVKKAGGVKSASSIHLNFDKETTAFRFSLRLDGNVPFKAPVTTEFGSYTMSAFVKLEAR